jgi:glycosyltransferase involved in cell wall biosynthesis
MAFRVPVVATDVIGNREAVSENVTGLLVPARNPSALAGAILNFLHNPELRKSMGNEGRKRVEIFFGPERFIGAHEEFYESFLDSH